MAAALSDNWYWRVNASNFEAATVRQASQTVFRKSGIGKMELLNIIAVMFSSSAASQGIDWLSDSPPRPRFDGAHRGLLSRARTMCRHGA
jgi:hypothetical protein